MAVCAPDQSSPAPSPGCQEELRSELVRLCMRRCAWVWCRQTAACVHVSSVDRERFTGLCCSGAAMHRFIPFLLTRCKELGCHLHDVRLLGPLRVVFVEAVQPGLDAAALHGSLLKDEDHNANGMSLAVAAHARPLMHRMMHGMWRRRLTAALCKSSITHQSQALLHSVG